MQLQRAQSGVAGALDTSGSSAPSGTGTNAGKLNAGKLTAPSEAGGIALAIAAAAFLLLFLVIPVATVIRAAFADGAGGLTFGHFGAFFGLTLMRESFVNSLVVALLSVLCASIIAVPLAYLTARFAFRGALLIQTLGVLPLIMPPFVGAVAMQLIFGKSGSVNLLLSEHFDITLPFMEGLAGVVFVESLHYFPFILLNLTAALANIDSAMEEAAQNLGSSGFALFRRVVFPLALPGYVAGASLVFVKVFDDLGTPLVLNVTNMLAPQAYLRITSVGLEDPVGYVISVLMIAFSVLAMWLASLTLRNRDYATTQRGGAAAAKRALRPWQAVLAYGWVVLMLLLTLSPHIGLLLLSFAKVWSFSPLPEAYTLEHYATMFGDSGGMLGNTLLYCGLAALIDVLLGVTIAWLILRSRLPLMKSLDFIATASLAIPGLVLAIGYLRTFRDVEINGVALAGSWLLIMLAYSIRRLPYALRACVAALQQVHVSLEEAAQNLGASRTRTMQRVMVPLMAGGILAGFVTSFITAAVELSATLLLTTSQGQAPMSYGIYLYMQSIAGRGPGAALGVLALVVVALGTFCANRVMRSLQHGRQELP